MKKIIATNVISGISLVALIVFGVQWLIFKNTPIYESYRVEIINNPVTGDEDIEFAMVGKKLLNCQASKVYAVATSIDGTEVILDQFTKIHIRNLPPGESVTNNWSIAKPKDMAPGIWRVDMVGHWECRYFVFKTSEVIRNHENILLVIK